MSRSRPVLHPGHPTARGGDDDWRYRLYDPRRELLRSSTRARFPSDGQLCRPCLQSLAAWPDPLTRIRDLPLPRYPPPGATGGTAVSAASELWPSRTATHVPANYVQVINLRVGTEA